MTDPGADDPRADRGNQATSLDRPTERLEMALEGANIGVWDWDMRTDDVERDELLTTMLGYTPDEMGDHLADWERLVHPAGERRHDEALAEHVADRTPYYEVEYRMETNAGEWKWVKTIGKVVERDGDGTPVRAVGIHQDIDERKRAELALEERERKYRHLFENTRDALVLFDRDGYRDCNERALELFGLDSVEACTDHVPEDLAPPVQPDGRDSSVVVAEHVERAFEEGEAFFEFVHERADGTTFPAEVKLSRFAYEGEPILQALVRNVSDRRERQRRLESEQNRIRAITSAIPDVVIVYDSDGRYREVLTGREGQLASDVDDLLGSTVDEVLDAPVARDIREAIDASLATGTVRTVEYSLELSDEKTWFEGRIAPLPGHDRDEVVMLARDVTARKETERQLQAQRDNLDVLNQMLRHDIRNDIQLITAYADILGEECPPAVREEIEIILENADHAVDLTTTAREMATVLVSADQDLEPVDLRETILAQLEDVRSAYPGAGLTAAGSIPPVTVRAHDMLDSVFRNLLKNAVQHNDTAVPTVTVSATAHEESVVVRVADDGPGIPDARKPEIFGKGETGLDSHGTGIGLYLVETLVETYGGQVRIEDNDPRGAVFVVELPLTDGGESGVDAPS